MARKKLDERLFHRICIKLSMVAHERVRYAQRVRNRVDNDYASESKIIEEAIMQALPPYPTEVDDRQDLKLPELEETLR